MPDNLLSRLEAARAKPDSVSPLEPCGDDISKLTLIVRQSEEHVADTDDEIVAQRGGNASLLMDDDEFHTLNELNLATLDLDSELFGDPPAAPKIVSSPPADPAAAHDVNMSDPAAPSAPVEDTGEVSDMDLDQTVPSDDDMGDPLKSGNNSEEDQPKSPGHSDT